MAGVERRAAVTDAERSLNNSGIPRWETNLRFYATSCVKAGYLQKGNGYWKITDAGRAAMTMSPADLFRDVARKYKAWAAARNAALPSEAESPSA